MNKWAKQTLNLIQKQNYLDRLQEIYPHKDKERIVDDKIIKAIRKAFRARDNVVLLNKLLDLESFLLIKKQRIRCAGSEIKNKFESLKRPTDILPNTIKTELNILRDSPDIKQLRDARDELNRFLPEHKDDKGEEKQT